MLKRLIAICLALLPLLAASCDRETTAELVLSVGINAATDSPLASLQESIPEVQERCELTCARDVTEKLIELRAMRKQPDASGHSDRAVVLVDGIANFAIDPETPDRLAVALQEAKLAALSVAADFDPAQFSEQRDDFHRFLVNEYSLSAGMDSGSVQRVVEVLSKSRISSNVRDLLALHAATYPDCDMNGELFLTASMQFANQRRFADAIQVAQEGLDLCSSPESKRLLSEQLEQLYAKNPQLAD